MHHFRGLVAFDKEDEGVTDPKTPLFREKVGVIGGQFLRLLPSWRLASVL